MGQTGLWYSGMNKDGMMGSKHDVAGAPPRK